MQNKQIIIQAHSRSPKKHENIKGGSLYNTIESNKKNLLMENVEMIKICLF